MEIDFELQHMPGRKIIVADVFSRLPSESMNQTDLDDDIPEYYVEHISNILTDPYCIFSVRSLQNIDFCAPYKLIIADILREQCTDALYRDLIGKIDKADSPYFLDNKEVLFAQS